MRNDSDWIRSAKEAVTLIMEPRDLLMFLTAQTDHEVVVK